MSVQVEVGFTLTSGDAPVFRVGDPVRGLIGSTTYKLGGPTWIDISSKVISASVSRGRNRQLDRFSAGSLHVRLNNEDRTFDPLNTASPYVGNIIPRRQIRLSAYGYVQFTGVIDEWSFDYSVSGESKADIHALDDFSLLSQQTLVAGTATPQLTGARVNAVLDMATVAWPSTYRTIDAGSQLLGADVLAGNVLEYLQQVETTEIGQLFMAKNGFVRFVSGDKSISTAATPILFTDDGSGVPYVEATVNYGTDLLYNQATISSPSGTAVADNLSSQSTYGITATSFNTLFSTLSQTQGYGSWIVNRYGQPEYRFETLTVDLASLSGVNRLAMLNAELGDIVRIKFTPNGVGAAIDKYNQIIKIEHSATPDRHRMSFAFQAVDYSFLVLDDTQFGILDSYTLAL